ncbi:MAG: CAP domain-containing protein [Spirochaetota bacterium]|nr:MAG: CAP domain-containing protein [Spirochaetota bacterium]
MRRFKLFRFSKGFYYVMISITIFIVGSAVSYADSSTVWDRSSYASYTHESFKLYGPANRAIDLENINYPLLNAAIFYETNNMREKHRKEPFQHSAALEKAAVLHSRDMAEKGFFSHTNPFNAQRETPSMRMALYGVIEGYRGENITEAFGIQYKPGSPLIPPENGDKLFRDYTTGDAIKPHTYNSFAEAVVAGWMESPPHRENILNIHFKFLGCGAWHFENRSFFNMDQFKVTQCFGSQVPD